jgi:hypothetical protein
MDMIILKEPIKVSERIRTGLERTKKQLLFSSNRNWFIILKDFKIEEKQILKKNWSLFGGKTTASTEYYLTEATILVWNNDKKIWAVLTESGVNLLLYYDDPLRMRKTYLDVIKSPLESLGVKFKVNETND